MAPETDVGSDAEAEAAFTRPFQVVTDLMTLAACRLAHARSPLYEPSEVIVYDDGRSHVELGSDDGGFEPDRLALVAKIVIPGWQLKTDRFFLNYRGELMYEFSGDHATVIGPRTYDTIRRFVETGELQAAADELITIVGP